MTSGEQGSAGESTTPTITVKRNAAITYDLPLLIKNNLPVDIRVAQQSASGPWNARPNGLWSTIADWGPATSAWGESWAFGTASDRVCGPASPDGPAFSYTDPATGTAATATAKLTIDCPGRPLDGNPPTTLTVAPQ